MVIEKDNELASNLQNKFNNQLTLINEDVLKIDESRYSVENTRGSYDFVGNLRKPFSTLISMSSSLNVPSELLKL